MKEANDVFENICLITVIIACVIVLIGAFPYIMRLLKGIHAATDSVSDFYHHTIKPKHNINMTTKDFNQDSEFYIDPDEVKLDSDELEVKLPKGALSKEMNVRVINQMYVDMVTDINRKRPITLMGQERQINKVRNQNIKIELLIDQMGLHNTMIKEATKLEATIRYAPNLIRDELEKMVITSKYEKQKLVETYLDEIDEIRTRRKVRDVTIKMQEAEHDRYIMETTLGELEMRAKINTILAHNRQEKARAALMEAALEAFENGDLSEKLQAYLIVSVFNFGDKSYVDLNMDEEMVDILKRDKKYDADKKKWEAKSTKEDFKHKKDKFDRQRKQSKDEE